MYCSKIIPFSGAENSWVENIVTAKVMRSFSAQRWICACAQWDGIAVGFGH